MSTSIRAKLLLAAVELTTKERNIQYGEPYVNLSAAGALKATLRAYATVPLDPAVLEALDMMLTKIGRIITGPGVQADTFADLAAYAAIAGECHHLSLLSPHERAAHSEKGSDE